MVAAIAVTRRRLVLAIVLVLASLTLATWRAFSFFGCEAGYLGQELADMAAQREREAKRRHAQRLQGRIERGGVAFTAVKGPFDYLDMTNCREPKLILGDVKEFASLNGDSPFYSISLMLGPAFCDTHIDDLADIPNLKHLDVSSASFSDEGFERLRSRLSEQVTIHVDQHSGPLQPNMEPHASR